MSIKNIKTCELQSEHEVLGMLEYSVMSSIVYVAKNNISLEAINALKVKIECIKATLWAIVGAAIGKEKNSQETFMAQKKQLEVQIETILELCNELKNFGVH